MIFKLMTTFLVGVFNIGFSNGFTTTSVINHMSFTHDVSLETASYDYNDTFGSGHNDDHIYSHSKSKSKSKTKSITSKIKSYSSKKTPKSISSSLDDEYEGYEEDEYDNSTGIDFNSLSNVSDIIYTNSTDSPIPTDATYTTFSIESGDTTVSTDTTISTESSDNSDLLEAESEQNSDTSLESGNSKKSTKHISKVVIPIVSAALSMFIVVLVIIRKERQKRDRRDKPIVKKISSTDKSNNCDENDKKREISNEKIFDQKYEDAQGYLVPSVKRAKYAEATKFNESKESESDYALAQDQHYEVPDSPEYDLGNIDDTNDTNDTNNNDDTNDDTYYEIGYVVSHETDNMVSSRIYDNNQIYIESTNADVVYNLPNKRLKSNQGPTYYSVATNTVHDDVSNEVEYDLANN